MKKALISIAALGGSLAAYAQDKPEPLIDRGLIFDVVHICAVFLIIYLIASFILKLVQSNFDFRLKSRIVERQTEEQVVGQLVRPDKANPLNSTLQWICALIGVGIGFLFMKLTEPYGLHSLAIMAFSVAAGLIIYYRFAKRTNH